MALDNLIIYDNRREARRAKGAEETIIRVNGGYALVSNQFYKIWKKTNRKH